MPQKRSRSTREKSSDKEDTNVVANGDTVCTADSSTHSNNDSHAADQDNESKRIRRMRSDSAIPKANDRDHGINNGTSGDNSSDSETDATTGGDNNSLLHVSASRSPVDAADTEGNTATNNNGVEQENANGPPNDATDSEWSIITDDNRVIQDSDADGTPGDTSDNVGDIATNRNNFGSVDSSASSTPSDSASSGRNTSIDSTDNGGNENSTTRRPRNRKTRSRSSSGKPNNHWTPLEEQRLVEGRAKGITYDDLSPHFGRTSLALRLHLHQIRQRRRRANLRSRESVDNRGLHERMRSHHHTRVAYGPHHPYNVGMSDPYSGVPATPVATHRRDTTIGAELMPPPPPPPCHSYYQDPQYQHAHYQRAQYQHPGYHPYQYQQPQYALPEFQPQQQQHHHYHPQNYYTAPAPRAYDGTPSPTYGNGYQWPSAPPATLRLPSPRPSTPVPGQHIWPARMDSTPHRVSEASTHHRPEMVHQPPMPDDRPRPVLPSIESLNLRSPFRGNNSPPFPDRY